MATKGRNASLKRFRSNHRLYSWGLFTNWDEKQFPTYLAEEAQQYSAIIVSAGKRGMQIELAPEAILSLTNGQFAGITTEE